MPSSIMDNPTLYEGTYLEFLGFRLIDWRDGYTRLEMPVRGEHRNTVSYLHGGVITSLLDIAGAVAGSDGNAQAFVSITVHPHVHYLAPPEADMAVAEGELIRSTSSLFFAQAKLFDPERKMLCATATGTYKKKTRGTQ